MKQQAQRRYVLVHGAWVGGWIWRDVITGLRAAGHAASAPTLSGLGERRHVGCDADLETHVTDVVAHIEMEDLTGVTLVGWSYGGMVTTGVLARIPGKIRAMIYLDAFVPQDGKAVADYVPAEFLAPWIPLKEADIALPPMPFASLGLTEPALIDYVSPRLVDQPWRTVFQPVKALPQRPDIPVAYIHCPANAPSPFGAFMEEMKKDPKVRTDTINTGHSPMLTELDETIRLLDKYGG